MSFDKLTLGGLPIVFDENVPTDTAYIVGPKAIENLQCSPSKHGRESAYDDWIADGTLVWVKLAP
jgi:hypothetical protein